MVGVVAGLWGAFGGFAVEGLELYVALRRHGRLPWKEQAHPEAGKVPEAGPMYYAIAEAVRLLIGAGLAWAAAATGQIAGPLGALGVGVAAPTIIGYLSKGVPLTVSPSPRGNPHSLPFISSSPPPVDRGPDLPDVEPGTAVEVVE